MSVHFSLVDFYSALFDMGLEIIYVFIKSFAYPVSTLDIPNIQILLVSVFLYRQNLLIFYRKNINNNDFLFIFLSICRDLEKKFDPIDLPKASFDFTVSTVRKYIKREKDNAPDKFEP